MNHAELCGRAATWLRSKYRCDPVLTRVASCREVPDAIGWSSRFGKRGSVVIECKTTKADFYADKEKYIRYKHPGSGFVFLSGRGRKQALKEAGYTEEEA